MKDKIGLVVDDNPANLDFLSRLMRTAGFAVHSAAHGLDAINAAQDAPELLFAIVDLELPDMNGIQLTAELRAMHPKAYIVVATMHDERALMDRVFDKGADVFLIKPHGFMELYKRMMSTDMAMLRAEPPTIIDQFGPRPHSAIVK